MPCSLCFPTQFLSIFYDDRKTGGVADGETQARFGIFSTSDLMFDTAHAAKREMKCSQLKKANRKERREKGKRKKQTEFTGCRTTFNLSKCIKKPPRRGIQMAHGQKSSDADPLRRRMTHSSLGTCMKKESLAEASGFPMRHPIREFPHQ